MKADVILQGIARMDCKRIHMHMAMEEPELEPCDLFVDMGLLVIEGRTPTLSTTRGYGEGPHCVPLQVTTSAQKVHICDPQNPQCAQQESFRKHMLLLWKNNIPMSIEVLLCPDCCHGNEKSGEATAGPEPSFILLEQWTIQMIPRRLPEVSIVPRALMQAVRSHLHFSQLSAWYSRSGGREPKNVVYRVCVPGEVFSNKFSKPPEEHVFPMANVGWNNILKVSVKAVPRCDNIPRVPCPLHDYTPAKVIPPKATSRRQLVVDSERKHIEEKKDQYWQQGYASHKSLDGPLMKKELNQTDLMLGDSLLDPPQCLEMYPKRYQSPSRSGSPVMETPEHWMFGGHGLRGRNPNRDVRFEGKGALPRERGRPWRRTERMDEKGNPVKKSSLDSAFTEEVDSYLTEIMRNCESPKQFLSQLKREPFSSDPEETFQLLHSLRTPFSCNLGAKFRKVGGKDYDSSSSSSSQRSHLPSGSRNDNLNDLLRRTKLGESTNMTASKERTAQRTRDAKSFVWVKGRGSLPISPLVHDALKDSKNSLGTTNSHGYSSSSFCDRWSTPTYSNSSNNLKISESCNSTILKTPFEDATVFYTDHERNESDYGVSKDLLSKRLSDMCYDPHCQFPTEDCLRDALNVLLSDGDCSLNSICKKEFPSEDLECNVDDGVQCQLRKEVPSAVDKAKFRRSLDSAAYLVFHARTGLPLTSSPAPVRKGTRFDFDSTLTSVAAIKHALFDKDDMVAEEEEEEEAQKLRQKLSTSAPPSIANNSSLLGNFEESVLNGRLEPVSTVEGFTAEIGASGSFCPRHVVRPVTVFFYTLSDVDKVSTPYLGHINLGRKGYHVPKNGTIQVTLFNPHGTVVKMFVVMYDLRDMPVRCQTFLRQRTLYMPVNASDEDPEARKWLRYLIHLRFSSSKSGRIYLHTDIRMVIFRKSDMDAATIHGEVTYELRSFTRGPTMPRFSPRR